MSRRKWQAIRLSTIWADAAPVTKRVNKWAEFFTELCLHSGETEGRFRQTMSKMRYGEAAPRRVRLGEWLRQLRGGRELALREVADAAGMDLAHLHKIELGRRLPTEEQTSRLAKFFKLDETETQARRIAEKFQHEFAAHPAAKAAIGFLAEEAGVYGTKKQCTTEAQRACWTQSR